MEKEEVGVEPLNLDVLIIFIIMILIVSLDKTGFYLDDETENLLYTFGEEEGSITKKDEKDINANKEVEKSAPIKVKDKNILLDKKENINIKEDFDADDMLEEIYGK